MYSENIIIAKLKEESSYYPSILTKPYMQKYYGRDRTVTYLSTLVRIKRKGVWYVVHCVEKTDSKQASVQKDLLLKLIAHVHFIQNVYKVTKTQGEVDSLQQSEEERLMEIIKGRV